MLKFTLDDSAVTVYYKRVDSNNDNVADDTHLLNGNSNDALYYAILEGYTDDLSQDGVTFTEIL